MLYLKVMSNEDLPDTDPLKDFSIIPINNTDRLVFVKDQSYPETDVHWCALIGPHAGSNQDGFDIPSHDKDRVVPLTGNAYVLNEQGKTIASHGVVK